MNVTPETAKKGSIQRNYCVYTKEHIKQKNATIVIKHYTRLIILEDTKINANQNKLVIIFVYAVNNI